MLRTVIRNLVRSPKRSVIILILQTAIITLFFLGNAVLFQSNRGLKEGFIDNFTGDAMVKVPSDLPVSVFGAITPAIEEFYTIAELPDPGRVKTHLLSLNEVEKTASLVSGRAHMQIQGYASPVPLFGIAGSEYFDFFPSLRAFDGSLLENGITGAMITLSRAERAEASLGRKLEIGEPVLLSTYANGIFRIRQVPLTGIIEYRNAGTVLNEVVLVDVQTLRELNQVSLAVDSDYMPAESAVSLMDNDLDSLFGESPFTQAGADNREEEGESGETLTLEGLQSLMKREDSGRPENLAGGGWHFILLRFSGNVKSARALGNINSALEGFGLEAVDWRAAAGFSAFLILLLQILFNGGFILVVTAGVIAIVNILVISVIERTGEIGTLRAIGASRGYVRRLLISENLVLSFISGIMAAAAAAAVISLLNSRQIEFSNTLLSTLFGGTVLSMNYSPSVAVLSLLLSLFLGAAASWFPVVLALRVQPVRAMALES